MRLNLYFCFWCIFLHVTLVTLVPVQKNANETNPASNSSFTDDDDGVLDAQPDNDENFRQEERSKRQSDDTDDGFKPKPSDSIEENASIDSQAFFYPVSNNGIERKAEPASNLLNGRLERIQKPNDEDVQIPLYDDDVDSNDDPLRGILDPKYWEEPDDASLKMDEFFAKLPLASMGGARQVEKESVEKEAKPKYNGDAEICDNTNSNDRMHDDKEMCNGGINIPNRFLHKQKGKNKFKKVVDQDKTRLKEGKKNFNKKKWDSELDEDRSNFSVNPEENQFQSVLNVSQIHSGLVNNLGSMFDTFLKEVANGVLKNTSSEDEQSRTVKYKTYNDAPQPDTINPGQELNDKKVLLPNNRRRLNMNDDDEDSFIKSSVLRNANITQYNGTLNITGRRLLSVEVEDNDNQEKPDKFSSLMSVGHLDNNASNFLFRSRRRLLSLDENMEGMFDTKFNANYELDDHLSRFNKDEGKRLDKSSVREDDKENYFAVDSMDNSKKDQNSKQRYFNFLKNEMPCVKHLDNKFLDKKFPPANLYDTYIDNPRMLVPLVRLPRKKWRRKAGDLPNLLEPEYISRLRKNREESKTTSEKITQPTSTADKSDVSAVSAQLGKTHHTEAPHHPHETATFPTIDDEDEQMNIDVSNKVVEAILAQAETHPDLRNSLGICRKGDLSKMKGSKMPENKLDGMIAEIMKCVGTLIKSHAEKSMCLMLDDNLHDFLQWLLLTGEPMHGKGYVAPKPDRDKTAFLFPSMCEQPPPGPHQVPPKATAG